MNVLFETKNSGNKAGKNEWLTPPSLVASLGIFDLDPCSPIYRPWDTALNHYTILDNGLSKEWEGRVWCNPPYGTETALWLNRCANYGNAMALTFARTETNMFFESVWNKANALLFIRKRISFYHITGVKGDSAGAPSVLIAYGENNSKVLETCTIKGKYIKLK